MTEPTPYAEQPAAQPTSSYATWGDRVIATLWDVVYLWPTFLAFVAGIVLLVAGIASSNDYETTSTGTTLTVTGGILIGASYFWMIVRSLRNYITIQGRTGQTWGKARVGIYVVNETTGTVPGWPSCLGRYLLHVLINYALYIDYLWPLWDKPKAQTLTDKILTTVVIKRV